MQWGSMLLLKTLLTASVGIVLVLLPAVWILQKLMAGSEKRKAIGKVISFSVCLFCAMWSLRLGLECFAAVNAGQENAVAWYEALVDTMLHTLDAFGGDKDYREHLAEVLAMIGALTQQNETHLLFWRIWVTVLEFLAPLASGAIILEALVNVFPRLKLWILRRLPWKTKFYFSRLNDGSLTLTESVMQMKHRLFCKPVVVFAGVDPAEVSEEMLRRAKRAGAFCVEESIAFVNKSGWGKRKLFLIGEEAENLQQLVGLSDDCGGKYLRDTEVYLFSQTDAYTRIEQSVYEKLKEGKTVPEDRLPVIIPVRLYRNLIVEMLIALPLYEPLLYKKPNKDGVRELRVTILGTGVLGTEMFLNTYWIGQMLDCELIINLVSEESENSFWGRIDTVNPEICSSTIENHEILTVNNQGQKAKPYCKVNYYCCNVHEKDYTERMKPDSKQTELLDTDYFFVALGEDTANIEQANAVRMAVQQYHLRKKLDSKTVITYVVRDSELSEALNRKKRYASAYKKSADVYMQAVGAHTQVYSAESVFMLEQEPLAQKLNVAYLSKQSEAARAEATKKRVGEDYNHWSSRARAAHRKYKIFSMGKYHQSVFEEEKRGKTYLGAVKSANKKAAQKAWADTEAMSPQEKEAHEKLMNRMAWLEHRRWNAFVRVYGFRSSKDYRTYADPKVEKSYKDAYLKLHPCLLECDDQGIRLRPKTVEVTDENGKKKEKIIFECDDPDALDLLDQLTRDLADGGYNDYDFKIYDYPTDDFEQPKQKENKNPAPETQKRSDESEKEQANVHN